MISNRISALSVNIGRLFSLIAASVVLFASVSVAQDKEASSREANRLWHEAHQLYEKGQYEQAIGIARQSFRIVEGMAGPEDSAVMSNLNLLGNLLMTAGHYAEARPLLERGLKIAERKYGADHWLTAVMLNNLASIYELTGDITRAGELFERALAIDERTLGPDHVNTTMLLTNLGEVRAIQGDLSQAKALLERSVKIFEAPPLRKHLERGRAINELARVLQAMGDHSRAQALYEQALKGYEQDFSPEHPNVAMTLNNLAGLHQAKGELAIARPYFERALQIRERTLGPEHLDVATSLNNLALLSWSSGDVPQAAELLTRSLSIADRQAQRGLVGIADRQKLLFLRLSERYWAHYLSLPDTAVTPSMAYTAVLNRKNQVFRVLAQERQHLFTDADPSTRQLIDRRTELIRQLTGLVIGGAGQAHIAGRSKQARELEQELERIEAEISRMNAVFREHQQDGQAGPREVCQSLPADTALLDYVRYARYLPQAEGRKHGNWENHYAAFLLRSGRCHEVIRVDIGPAVPVEQAINQLRRSLSQGGGEAAIRPDLRRLGTLLLPPRIFHELKSVNHLIVAPDGAIALFPFQLLLPDERTFLIEQVTISTIPSGRDLLRVVRERPAAGIQMKPKRVLLVGNPDFGKEVAVVHEEQGRQRALRLAGCGLDKAEFSPLPGTAKEIDAIGRIAKATGTGQSLLRVEGSRATEAVVDKESQGRHYLHLATHGFFTGDACGQPVDVGPSRGVLVQVSAGIDASHESVGTNPLLLSGVALAGVNRRTLATNGMEDGVLTALEVTTLDLRRTELVVLSACETGLGTVQTGQELLGLRWAFSMAGAGSLMTSLWKVPDESTTTLMTKFYENLWQNPKKDRVLGKASAIQQAQLALMRENRQKYQGDSRPMEWAAWVLSGDWQ